MPLPRRNEPSVTRPAQNVKSQIGLLSRPGPCDNTMGGMLAALGQQGGVAGEVKRPPGVVGDAVGHGLPSRAMPVDVAVLQLDQGPPRSLGGEADLDLAGVVRLGLDLPLRTDVPAEHHAVRRVVGEYTGPAALAAVPTAVVDVATHPRFEDGLGDRYLEHVVLRRLEFAEPLGEYSEGPFDRRLHSDLPADHGGRFLGHGSSTSGCSARSW